MTSSLPVRVARRHLVATLYAERLESAEGCKSLAATVASRYISVVGGSLKQQAKKRYELAKSMLKRSESTIQAWLVVIDSLPGWKKEKVDDPDGDRFKLVYDVAAPNGKTMLVYPQSFSKEHAGEFNRWMRKETDALEQLEKEVKAFEAAAQAAEAPKPSSVDLGTPIAKVDFTDPKRNVWLVDFGLRDERGRAVGCKVSIWAPGEYHSEPSHWALVVQATRNGERFGSSRGHMKADSRKAVETLARKSMMASFKRYSALYGGR